jgi:hypothetical protein
VAVAVLAASARMQLRVLQVQVEQACNLSLPDQVIFMVAVVAVERERHLEVQVQQVAVVAQVARPRQEQMVRLIPVVVVEVRAKVT